MRRIPILLALTFITITLTRVATLASGPLGAGYLGWVFAVGLGVGVYASSYWMKVADTKTKWAAGTTLVFFCLTDLVFNNAEVYRSMAEKGAWDGGLLMYAGIVYASFPTVAAGLLGWLQGRVDRLPPAPIRRGEIIPRIRLWIAAQIDSQIPQDVGSAPQAAPQFPQTIDATKAPAIAAPQAARGMQVYRCGCGRTFIKQNSYAAHKKHCKTVDPQSVDVAAQEKRSR